jgi:asparagine synthase (glutamine-hydrolysing)
MCGICGELRFDGVSPDLTAVERMSKQLARRGPDHEGSTVHGPLTFGHRRLAVIDLSANANQPLVDSALELSIVFNGTIYNYKELRSELRGLGYSFFTEGDTEVILKSYHAWGERCVERFYGMFAFAIWEISNQTLFLARDRFGIKPLYYSLSGSAIRFASTVQALLAGGSIDTGIDPVALHFHVTLHAVVPAPRTLLKGVRKLPPAVTMKINATGTISQRTYWTLNATRPAQPLSEEEWLEATRTQLTRAVERHRLAADVPVGVFLSGGLDSSLLVGLLANQNDDLQTFSIGFENVADRAAKGDEFEYSDLIAECFKTRHHKYVINNSEVLKRLPEAVMNMSEPMGSHDVVAFYLLSELVSKHVKVVMSGQGADEIFGGYFWYSRMNEATGSPSERFSQFYSGRDHAEYLEMVTPTFHVADVTSEWVNDELSKPDADSFLDQVWRMDISTLMPDSPVRRVDNMPMSWGLEARVPFLDHELVELAARMPP